MTVLLWGRAAEPVIDATARACTGLGIDTVAADGEELVSVEPAGDLVTRDGQRVKLADVTGILVRPEGHIASVTAIAAYQALSAWAELATVAVLNRPSAAASNRSKPYQLGPISAAGFAVPDTLVTTSPDDVRAFCAEHEQIVYKSISGIRSIVAMLNPDNSARLDDVVACPTQFQQFIDGADHRVHVIGDTVLACRIDSTAIDYRYPAASDRTTTMSPVILRDDVEHRCRDLARALGLSLAGIDLKLDRDGQWWCLEVNTAPGFIWFEHHTGLPITDAVANLLAYGAEPIARSAHNVVERETRWRRSTPFVGLVLARDAGLAVGWTHGSRTYGVLRSAECVNVEVEQTGAAADVASLDREIAPSPRRAPASRCLIPWRRITTCPRLRRPRWPAATNGATADAQCVGRLPSLAGNVNAQAIRLCPP
jgi:glutathione synthase/RimK-type ligase-like ATP-grasp enzyme